MDSNLRQQLGQLFMVGFDGLAVNAHIARLIEQYRVGGVILFRRNIASPQQLSRLCRELQQFNARFSATPLLIALDQEGGMVMRIEQGVTPMPSAMAFAQAGSVADCAELQGVSAAEMRALGINMMLAPVLDINNNVRNPVIGVRAFGEDPQTVTTYGLAAIRGIEAQGMIATAKHFPGHGDTAVDSHLALPVIAHDRPRLDRIELVPFRAAIAQGVAAIMTAHVFFPAVEPHPDLPATLSRAVVTGLLREELGYEGVIMTDCLEMSAIANGVGVAEGALLSLLAGNDLVLISHLEQRQVQAMETVLRAIESQQLDTALVTAACQRVQRLKQISAVRDWQQLPAQVTGLQQTTAMQLTRRVQAAALRSTGCWRPLDCTLPLLLITVSVQHRTEIDEVAAGGPAAGDPAAGDPAAGSEARSSMLPLLLAAGLDVQEIVLPLQPSQAEIDTALARASKVAQIVVQTYNAVLSAPQQELLTRLPASLTWLVAGRLPYDLDLLPEAQGRLAGFGCRPAALLPVVEKLIGK